MTVVAGLAVPNGPVVMAADRQQTHVDTGACWPSQPKIQRHQVGARGGAGSGRRRDALIAVCGSAATGNLVRYRLEWPALPGLPQAHRRAGGRMSRPSGGTRPATEQERADAEARYAADLDRWAFDVTAAITELVADVSSKGKADDDDGPVADFAGGMLAAEGRLWSLGPYNALPLERGWEAIGSGGFVATGALALQVRQGRHLADPADVVRLAVELACEHDAHCGGPIDVEVLERTC